MDWLVNGMKVLVEVVGISPSPTTTVDNGSAFGFKGDAASVDKEGVFLVPVSFEVTDVFERTAPVLCVPRSNDASDVSVVRACGKSDTSSTDIFCRVEDLFLKLMLLSMLELLRLFVDGIGIGENKCV